MASAASRKMNDRTTERDGNTALPLPYAGLTRGLTAAMIATGGLMHAIGLYGAVRDSQPVFWWVWIFFVFAVPGYLFSAVAIVRDRLPGLLIALAAPPVGGFFILIGFLYPQTELLRLIPGTYGHEIRLIGFFTLICEPVATTLAGQLLLWKMLTYSRGLAKDNGPKKSSRLKIESS